MELYCERQDERDAKRAARIVENLYLPLLGHFLSYPSDPEKRVLKGDAAGHIAGNTLDGWMLSTDIGCAFISLDALTQYYSLFGGEQIRALICEMIESFKNIDVENCSMQIITGSDGPIGRSRAQLWILTWRQWRCFA